MTESLKPSAETRAGWNKEQERVKDEQQARIDATVDEWMKDEGTVENALLEAVQEVSGDMALIIAEMEKDSESRQLMGLSIQAMKLLITQIRKQLQEKAQEHLYG